jgi:hypothetical protein
MFDKAENACLLSLRYISFNYDNISDKNNISNFVTTKKREIQEFCGRIRQFIQICKDFNESMSDTNEIKYNNINNFNKNDNYLNKIINPFLEFSKHESYDKFLMLMPFLNSFQILL